MRRIHIQIGVGARSNPEEIHDFTDIERHVRIWTRASLNVEVIIVVVMLDSKVRLSMAALLIGICHDAKLIGISKDLFGR